MHDDTHGRDLESLVLLVPMLLAGSVPVIVAMVHGARLGAEASIGLILVAFSAWNIVRELATAPRWR